MEFQASIHHRRTVSIFFFYSYDTQYTKISINKIYYFGNVKGSIENNYHFNILLIIKNIILIFSLIYNIYFINGTGIERIGMSSSSLLSIIQIETFEHSKINITSVC